MTNFYEHADLNERGLDIADFVSESTNSPTNMRFADIKELKYKVDPGYEKLKFGNRKRSQGRCGHCKRQFAFLVSRGKRRFCSVDCARKFEGLQKRARLDAHVVAKAIQEHGSYRQAAKALGISADRVGRIGRNIGLKPKCKIRRALEPWELAEAAKEYESGLSTKAVAGLYGCSQAYMYEALRAYFGRPLRPKGRHSRNICKHTNCKRPVVKFQHTTQCGTYTCGNECAFHRALSLARTARERYRKANNVPKDKWRTI